MLSDQLTLVVAAMTKLTRHKTSTISLAVSALCLLIALEASRNALVTPSTASPSSLACTPIPPPPCKDAASPGVIQLIPDVSNPSNKLKLARKRFYLSSCPFNLAENVDLRRAPSLRNYYSTAGASPQLIAWLEQNNCETIYCRELTANEVSCEGANQEKCVPEFTTAYKNALSKLNGDQALALKLITNYPPLSSSKLSTGFYHEKNDWLKTTIEQVETELESDHRIKSMITDKDGIAFSMICVPVLITYPALLRLTSTALRSSGRRSTQLRLKDRRTLIEPLLSRLDFLPPKKRRTTSLVSRLLRLLTRKHLLNRRLSTATKGSLG